MGHFVLPPGGLNAFLPLPCCVITDATLIFQIALREHIVAVSIIGEHETAEHPQEVVHQLVLKKAQVRCRFYSQIGTA